MESKGVIHLGYPNISTELPRALIWMISFFVTTVLWTCLAEAQPAGLQDRNGDGIVHILAFGDSITYGVGDGYEPGESVVDIDFSGEIGGYPARISLATGVSVSNAGVPGERMLFTGVYRFPQLIANSDVDTVLFMEGANDAIHRILGNDYRVTLQKIMNVARAEGKYLIVGTLPAPVAFNQYLSLYTSLYSSIMRELAVINSISVADIEQRYAQSCPVPDICELYNIPEGLHPNTLGYDVMAEEFLTVLGTES
jgi:lysophospholipase L1-like esterase